MNRSLYALMLVPALAAGTPGKAAAAESYDNCAGFIDAVPAVITTQGVWCLRADIATAIGSGAAITINTNNVTIDCNDFKLGGLGAGPGSFARGITANNRLNATVRNCAIRGFREGIAFIGASSGGHLVEHNRLDGNLFAAINVEGTGNMVAYNRVIDTGGATSQVRAIGILADADIIENTVDGVFATSGDTGVRGIQSSGASVEIRGNRIRNLQPSGTAAAQGILSGGASAAVIANRITTSSGTPNDRGIFFSGGPSPQPFCGGNTISGFATPIFSSCLVAGANFNN